MASAEDAVWGPPAAEVIAADLRRLAVDRAHLDAIAAIRPGRFRRDPQDSTYAARLRYTAALRGYVYNPSLLEVVLSLPWLKTLFFRSFGYRGSTEFTIYPSCWIRDLPLLDIGERAYLADGIVLGSNQVSVDQQWIRVGRITIGARTIFDQQCMVGYGSSIGQDCVIGVRVSVGMNVRIGTGCKVGPSSTIGHQCRIGNGVTVGHAVTIGNFSRVDDGIEIPDYTCVPQFSHVSRDAISPRRRHGVD